MISVQKPHLSFFQKLYLPEVLRGLYITIRHLIRRKTVTAEYPEKPYPVPPNFRGLHRLILRPNGTPHYEFSSHRREDFIFTKDRLMENNRYVPVKSDRVEVVDLDVE